MREDVEKAKAETRQLAETEARLTRALHRIDELLALIRRERAAREEAEKRAASYPPGLTRRGVPNA